MSGWLFDLGNSRLKYARLEDDGRLGETVAIAHDGLRFLDDPIAALPALMTTAWVASVAPQGLRDGLLDALGTRCERVSLASTRHGFGDIEIAYRQPAQLGVDRFLALIAARARSRQASLVVGVGSALTIDWLDADARHRGGRIAPSPTLMRAALHARAAQLPPQGGTYTEFADNTADAVAAGCLGAGLALIERSLRHATEQTGATPQLLLHGGGRDQLLPHLPDAVDAPALVLEGLAQWARVEI